MAGELFSFGHGDPRELDSPDDWGPERTIRGQVLAELLVRVGVVQPTTVRLVGIEGARVTGEVNLGQAEVTAAVHFGQCLFEHDMLLLFARTRSLQLKSCALASVDAMGASIEGLLVITQSDIRGDISLAGARVDQSIVLSGSRITGVGGQALTADGLKAGGSMFLRDGFRATGVVRLPGARISGQLICSGGRFCNPSGIALGADGSDIRGGAFLGTGFHAKGEVRLLGARIGNDLNCSGARFENRQGHAFRAEHAQIDGNVFLGMQPGTTNRFHATGEVRLSGARIGNDLNCSGARFENRQGHAFRAEHAQIDGNVFLGMQPGTTNRFHATGEVRLSGARIGGDLDCTGGLFENSESDALSADRISVGDNLHLQCGFHATGEVRFLSARIGGDLDCTGGRFENSEGAALGADGADIRGNAFLKSDFHATGEVRFPGARIGGDLDCTGGRFENSGGDALSADSAEVRGNATLRDGFNATGTVRFPDAKIGSNFAISDATLSKENGNALNLRNMRAAALWLRGSRLKISGTLDFRSAQVGMLADTPQALSDAVTLHIDGFVYERIAPDSSQNVKTRLQWLERQSEGYHPQPYDQLAEVFRRNGQDYEAREVLIAKRRKRRKTLLHGWPHRFWDCFLDRSVLYGWQPWRPLMAGVGVFLLAFVLVFAARTKGLVVSLPDTVSPYHSFIHALDVFLPIIDLGVESRWTINTANGSAFAWVVIGFLWFLKLVGWGTVTLALAALTGVVKRE